MSDCIGGGTAFRHDAPLVSILKLFGFSEFSCYFKEPGTADRKVVSIL